MAGLPASRSENALVKLGKQVRRSIPGYTLALPAVLAVVIFSYYPFLSGLLHSLTRWNGLRSTFIGLENFRELMQDQIFLTSFINTAKLLMAGILKTITMPILASELVFWLRSRRLAYVFRLVFVVPLVIPEITNVLLWQHIFSYRGALNNFLMLIGRPDWRADWLGHPDTAMLSIILMGFPYISVLGFLVYLSALQGIPEELFDAAQIDGVNWLQRVFRIDLPLIRPQIIMLSILACIGAVETYFTILILTDGGPGFSTMVPGLYLYKSAFSHMRFGFASAIAVIMLLVSGAFTLLGIRLMKER